MRIRTQFIVTMALFGVVLAVISASLMVTNHQVNWLAQQQELARNIERQAGELGYLSNEYLLYRERQQRDRWESKFSAFSTNLSELNPNVPEQQALVNNIRANQQRLKAVFGAIVASLETGFRTQNAADVASIQVPWSRIAVQIQGIVSDASRLSQMVRGQADQLDKTNLILILALIGIFGAYFLANYSLIYRHALRSIEELQAGTNIIGSGNLEFAIPVRRADEIGELSRAFNRMTANLKDVTASKSELEREIAERKRAEGALRESEAKYRNLFENMTEEVHFWKLVRDEEGCIKTWRLVDANPPTLRTWGKTREEIAGKTTDEIFGHGATEHYMPVVQKIMMEGVPHSFEDYFPNLDKYFRFTSVPLGDYFITTGADITTLRKTNQALRASQAKLEATNKELDAFAYSVSHDLRAPLRGIDSFSRILQERYAAHLEDDAVHCLQMIRGNAVQMGRLIDDLLAFSRVSQQPLRKEPVQQDALVRAALKDLESEQKGRQIDLGVGELAAVEADPNLLRQVWVNLISNALKYTRGRERAEIRIGSEFQDGVPVYFVKDNGVGFDMRYAHKLFGVFQRLHRPEDYEGTGVGLAIVQRIITGHGGRIWTQAAKNQGATFYFTLQSAHEHDRQ